MGNDLSAGSNVRQAREGFLRSDIIVAKIVHPCAKVDSEMLLSLCNGGCTYSFFSSFIGVKKVSRGLSRVEAGNPGFPRLVQVTSEGFSWWL